MVSGNKPETLIVMADIVTETFASALASPSTIDAARAGYPEWRSWRLQSVGRPTGNLALVETRWLRAG